MVEDDLDFDYDTLEDTDETLSEDDVSFVDVHVGERIKTRRLILRMKQEELALKMGMAFQQLQKYEKGLNRIGAGKLWQFSQVLEVPIEYFFYGINRFLPQSFGFGYKDCMELSDVSNDELDINKKLDNIPYLFSCIPNDEIKLRLYDLIKSVAVIPEKNNHNAAETNPSLNPLFMNRDDVDDFDENFMEEDIF